MSPVAQIQQVKDDRRRLGVLRRKLAGRGNAAEVKIEVVGAGEIGLESALIDLGIVAALGVVEGGSALHVERQLASDDGDMTNEPGKELLIRLVGGERHVVIDLTDADFGEELGREDVGRGEVFEEMKWVRAEARMSGGQCEDFTSSVGSKSLHCCLVVVSVTVRIEKCPPWFLSRMRAKTLSGETR